MLDRARAKDAGELAWEWANALDAALRGRRASTPRPSASARATSPTSTRGIAEMARVVRPGGKVVILEITTPQQAAAVDLLRVWFDHVVPALGKLAGDPPPTRTCRARSSASRARGSRRGMAGAGLRDIRWILTAGGIIAIHVGTRA